MAHQGPGQQEPARGPMQQLQPGEHLLPPPQPLGRGLSSPGEWTRGAQGPPHHHAGPAQSDSATCPSSRQGHASTAYRGSGQARARGSMLEDSQQGLAATEPVPSPESQPASISPAPPQMPASPLPGLHSPARSTTSRSPDCFLFLLLNVLNSLFPFG